MTIEGTNPLTMSEGLSTDTSLLLGRNIDLENTKLLLELLELHPNGFVNTSAICSSVTTYWSFTAPLCTISLI